MKNHHTISYEELISFYRVILKTFEVDSYGYLGDNCWVYGLTFWPRYKRIWPKAKPIRYLLLNWLCIIHNKLSLEKFYKNNDIKLKGKK